MSNIRYTDSTYRVIRERIFFEHSTPDEREIIEEITLLNTSNAKLRAVFLIQYEFMVGLKIFDSKNRELPYYPNDFAIDLLNLSPTYKDSLGKSTQQNLLNSMKEKKAFFLWISLPEEEPLAPNESMILKLKYTNTKKTTNLKFKELFTSKNLSHLHLRIFFNIPKFSVKKEKPLNSDYDTFYLVSAPEGYTLNYVINEAVYIERNETTTNIEDNKIHKNLNDKILYVRTPHSEKATKFSMDYYVLPKKNEYWFYLLVIFGMIAFSGLLLYSGTVKVNEDSPQFLKNLHFYSPTLYGGIFTGSVAAIGFLRDFALKRTRFWFLAPMVISAIGFLFFSGT